MKDLLLLLVSVAIGAIGQIAFKFGAMQMVENPGITLLEKIKLPIVLGLFLYGISTILWIMALKKVELSYAYPMVSLGYIFVFIASYFIFHEPLNWLRMGGMLFILAGITLVAKS
jgi:multidrug transporter EmrE-like cation transporter